MKNVMFLAVLLVFICCIGAASATEDVTNDTLSSQSVDVIEQADAGYQDSVPASVEPVSDESLDSVSSDVDDDSDSISSSIESDEKASDSASVENDKEVLTKQADDTPLKDTEKVVVEVSDWSEMKTYAEKTDADYIIKLKEGIKYTIGSDIQFKNNAEIVGNGKCLITGTANNRIPFKSVSNRALNITFKNVYFKDIKCQMVMQLQTNGISIVENCTFRGITAGTGHHSVIYNNYGVMNVTGCKFYDSSAGFGVITNHNQASTTAIILHVNDCYFENNYGGTEPGCINNCGVLTVENSTFTNNRAYWWAGAIHTHSNANTKIYGSTFIDNVAGWNGGALYTYSYLEIHDSMFVGNNCTTNAGGGAIGASAYGSTPNIFIENCTFKDNTNTASGGAGGAIAAMDKGDFKLYNSTFINNNAEHGTAVAASAAAGYGSPTLVVYGNTFINHTRYEDVLRIALSGTSALVANNTFINNAIPTSKLYLNASDAVNKIVTVTITHELSNPSNYDVDILDKCKYDVYVDGKYFKTINGKTFDLSFEDIDKCKVYVIPSIYTGASNELTIVVPRDYVYVSQKSGSDENDGITNQTPVKTIAQALKIAKSCENIMLMDGNFAEENLTVDYRLTIWGTEDSSISGAIANNMFNVDNAKFSLRNLTIKNVETASKLVNGKSSRIFLDNCIVESNTFSTFVESDALGITNTLFKNNKLSMDAKELTINNATFDNNSENVLLKSDNAGEWTITESSFINNHDLKSGLINYASASSTLNIENVIFENNNGGSQASVMVLGDAAELNVLSTIFKNNDDKLALIYKNGSESSIKIRDSIIFAAGEAIDGNLSNVDCDYNWWGNSYENMKIAPSSKLTLNNWLFLNMEYEENAEIGKTYDMVISIDLVNADGTVSKYNGKLPETSYAVTVNNATADINNFTLNNNEVGIKYSLTGLTDGSLTVTYEKVVSTATFKFIKTTPEISTDAKDIKIEDVGKVVITVPNDATGNVTIKVGNITQTKEVKDGKVQFDIEGLPEGSYDLTVNYTGDAKYTSGDDSVKLNVVKHDSTTKINSGVVKVSDDVVLTIVVPTDATGNVTLNINGEDHVLDIENGKATYTIANITNGDWIIKAAYSGNYKYNPSSDSTRFEVAKQNANVIINAKDIIYKQDAKIEIIMDEDATGNVTIAIDDIVQTQELVGGKVVFTISNLSVGYKDIKVSYDGDNHYYSQNYTATLYVDKAPIQFTIESNNNVKEGKALTVVVKIEQGTEGEFIIEAGDYYDSISVPESGEATWDIYDLVAGNHTITVTYRGENYSTCRNTKDITILAWDEPQWASDDSGKSPYDANVDGTVEWNVKNENISGNIVIDSEGNIYVISASGINSYDVDGKLRWTYSANGVFSGLTIGRDVVIAPISGDSLYIINATSGEKAGANLWKASSKFAPIIDKHGNIFVSGEKNYETGDYSLVIVPYTSWETGDDVISINLGKSEITTSPVLVADEYVCVGTADGLKIINIENEEVVATANIVTDIAPIVGDGDIIYVASEGALNAISKDGTPLWKADMTAGKITDLAIDNEKGILYAVNGNKLYKYDLLDSGKETLVNDSEITSGILVGNDGVVYVASANTLMAIGADGVNSWKNDIDNITGTPVMGKNGMIYVNGENNLVAFTKYVYKDANIELTKDNVEAGENAKLVITLDKNATGNITVTINGTVYPAVNNNGVLEIGISNLSVGSYAVEVSYDGDSVYAACDKVIPFNVTKVETTPEGGIDDSKQAFSDNPTYSINLPSDATGNFTVNVDGTEYSAELKNGSASITIPKLSKGKHNIIISYSGDGKYAPFTKTQTVTVYDIKITGNKNIVTDYNSGATYKVRVYGKDGKVVVGGTVTFKINKKTIKVKTNKKGYASIKITQLPKKYTVTATYGGVKVKNTIKVKQILKSKNVKVKKSAKKLVLKATLKSSKGKAIKGKKIKFKFKGKTYKAKTNKKGIAKVTIKKKVIKKLKKGKKYPLKVTYLKDTIKKTVRVKK